jgi:hypothetical protein
MTTTHYDYLSDIEATFVKRRGANLFLGSKDWALMQSWEQQGIPLHIVIRAIEDVFDRTDKKISTIAYCRNAVEEAFSEWSRGQVGKQVVQQSVIKCDECLDLGFDYVDGVKVLCSRGCEVVRL